MSTVETRTVQLAFAHLTSARVRAQGAPRHVP
jgi:hypothetical protein